MRQPVQRTLRSSVILLSIFMTVRQAVQVNRIDMGKPWVRASETSAVIKVG
jgi:hypothetical protein